VQRRLPREGRAVIAPAEQQTFPSTFKDQLAAVRDLLRTQGGEWTVAQVKAQFKNASRKQKAIQDCLDTLTDLGAIALHTEADTPRWYSAAFRRPAALALSPTQPSDPKTTNLSIDRHHCGLHASLKNP
jgi:hypothetical protein